MTLSLAYKSHRKSLKNWTNQTILVRFLWIKAVITNLDKYWKQKFFVFT